MVINILTNTPFYVYWIFFSLLFVGISQTKKRKVSLYRAVGIPFVLIILSIYAIIHDFGINLFSTSIWIGGIILILLLNKIVKSEKDVEYSPSTKNFTIGGSYIPLIMMMTLFFTKYSVGVISAINSPLLNSMIFISVASMFYGIFSGMYILRLLSLIQKMKD